MDSLGGRESYSTHIGRGSICRFWTDGATVSGGGETGQEGHDDGSGKKMRRSYKTAVCACLACGRKQEPASTRHQPRQHTTVSLTLAKPNHQKTRSCYTPRGRFHLNEPSLDTTWVELVRLLFRALSSPRSWVLCPHSPIKQVGYSCSRSLWPPDYSSRWSFSYVTQN